MSVGSSENLVKGPARPETSQASEREREFFDQLIAEKGDFNQFTDRGWDVLADCFVKMVRPARDLSVLEVGCGTGESRRIYVAHAKRLVGVDLSSRAVFAARHRTPECSWVQANACTLPFAQASFDLVAFSSTLHHIPGYEAALREAWRVLRRGGKVFSFDPNLLHPGMALFRHPSSPLYLAEGVSPNERPMLPRILVASFKAVGFTKIIQDCKADIPYRSFAPRILRPFVKTLNGANWLLDRCGLGRWFGTFVLVAAQKPLLAE